jgi:hypothetical protein
MVKWPCIEIPNKNVEAKKKGAKLIKLEQK